MSEEKEVENGEPVYYVPSCEEWVGSCNLWTQSIGYVPTTITICDRCGACPIVTHRIWSDNRFDGGPIRTWIYPLTGGAIYT